MIIIIIIIIRITITLIIHSAMVLCLQKKSRNKVIKKDERNETETSKINTKRELIELVWHHTHTKWHSDISRWALSAVGLKPWSPLPEGAVSCASHYPTVVRHCGEAWGKWSGMNREGRNWKPCQQKQHAKLCSDLLQAQKEGTFDSPGLPPGGSLVLHPRYPTAQ